MSMKDCLIRLKIGKNGRCTFPEWARNDFDIREGDKLYVLIIYKMREFDEFKEVYPYKYSLIKEDEV